MDESNPAVTPVEDTPAEVEVAGQQQQQGDGTGDDSAQQSTAAGEGHAITPAEGQPDGAVQAPVTPGPADPAAAADSPASDGEGAVSEAAPSVAGLSAEQLGRLRETLVAANPDAVPELIAGGDFDSLLASVEGAKAAYASVAQKVRGEVAASLPRGGGARTLDPATVAALSPSAKIALGIEQGQGGHPA